MEEILRSSDPKSVARRPREKTRLLGQFFTPMSLATRMVKCLLRNYQGECAKILDPCVGPHTFPEAMLNSGLLNTKQIITSIDIDPEMFFLTREWSKRLGVNSRHINADYLELPQDAEFDYAILNPPYVRQEWLDKKNSYQHLFKERYGLSIPGTSNLYVYFLVKVIMDLKPGGQFSCIVYDSWQSTQYGRWILAFLQHSCSSLQIETVADQPFNKRLIDATIIQGMKKPIIDWNCFHVNSLQNVKGSVFSDIQGFSSLEHIFSSERGLRLKQADFFLVDIATYPSLSATPFLKKIGKLRGYSIPENHTEAALLVAPGEKNTLVTDELQRRIILAQRKPDENASILTWFQERPESWLFHKKAPYAPILFNYYLRNRPKHIFNPDRKYSDNFYGLIPFDNISSLAYLAILNSSAVGVEILTHARNQGNGLAKIQLFEYRKIHVPDLKQCSEKERASFHQLGRDLIEYSHLSNITLEKIDALVAAVFCDSRLAPCKVKDAFRDADLKARKPKEEAECLG